MPNVLTTDTQLETVVYAGSAWTQWIPGSFRPDKEGVGLLLDENGARYRKGFFLGDGTGAGKGRQVAAVVLDNWLQGRRRAIWISKNEPLLDDARRDWTALGGIAYAVRLGLWGPETAFANREAFISSIRQGGIAAMELVARDLKATGLYMARALSFAGVEYEILRHELTEEQIAIYDTYADAWSIIHRNMEAALELTGVVDELDKSTLNSGAKAAARSRFESTKQRFFVGTPMRSRCPLSTTYFGKCSDGPPSVETAITVSLLLSATDFRMGENIVQAPQSDAKK